MADERGQSAVIVPVFDAEPIVSSWRDRYDPSAALGMPAHVTALYPFLSADRVTDSVIARLSELCGVLPALDVRFRRTARFPRVLYLDPEPAEGLRTLTGAIFEQWPEAPPFGGAFDEVIPHLTIANGADHEAMAAAEQAIRTALPLRTRLSEAWLYVFDGLRWHGRVRMGFGTRELR